MGTENLSGLGLKRGFTCACGNTKIKGAPFCRVCWDAIGPAWRAKLETTTTYNVDFAAAWAALEAANSLVLAQPAAEAASASGVSEDGQIAITMLLASEAQMDRIWSAAPLEDKAVAINALMRRDRERNERGFKRTPGSI